ncbi:MAG: hypothetical protein ACOCWM_01640 [Cyclobacteriaceae bacterium]
MKIKPLKTGEFYHNEIQTIPQKYVLVHQKPGTWKSDDWKELIAPAISDKKHY